MPKVKPVDIAGIFYRAAGRPMDQIKRVIGPPEPKPPVAKKGDKL